MSNAYAGILCGDLGCELEFHDNFGNSSHVLRDMIVADCHVVNSSRICSGDSQISERELSLIADCLILS